MTIPLVIVLHFKEKMTIISKQCKLNRHLSSTFSAHLWICLGLFAVVSVFPNHFSWEDLLLYEKLIKVLISGNIFMHCKNVQTFETLVFRPLWPKNNNTVIYSKKMKDVFFINTMNISGVQNNTGPH